MAHEIDNERAIYARNPAWHRLGVVKKEGWFTAEEALSVLNPNGNEITKVPAYAAVVVDGKTEYVMSDDVVAVMEPHPDVPGTYRILSFMARDYGVVQIEDQFRFLDEVVGAIGGAHYETAARLRNGKQTIATIATDAIALDPNGASDQIKRYIFGSNSYDGSWAFRVKMTNVRVECANMAAVALNEKTPADWSTKHTKNVMDRANAAAQTLGLYASYNELWVEQAERMIECEISEDSFTRLLDGLFVAVAKEQGKDGVTEKDREAMAEVRTIYELSPSVERIRGTVWGALNSVTEWSDWFTKVRGGKKTSMEEARLRRQMGETDGGLKQMAWDSFYGFAKDERKVVVSVP